MTEGTYIVKCKTVPLASVNIVDVNSCLCIKGSFIHFGSDSLYGILPGKTPAYIIITFEEKEGSSDVCQFVADSSATPRQASQVSLVTRL